MFRPNDVQNKDIFESLIQNLDYQEQQEFMNIINFINKIIFNKIILDKSVKNINVKFIELVVNSIGEEDYLHVKKYENINEYGKIATCYDEIIDPIITTTDTEEIKGIERSKIRKACQSYLKEFGWKFSVLKIYQPEHRIVKLSFIFEQNENMFFKPSNIYVDDHKITNSKKKIDEHKIFKLGYENCSYEDLEI